MRGVVLLSLSQSRVGVRKKINDNISTAVRTEQYVGGQTLTYLLRPHMIHFSYHHQTTGARSIPSPVLPSDCHFAGPRHTSFSYKQHKTIHPLVWGKVNCYSREKNQKRRAKNQSTATAATAAITTTTVRTTTTRSVSSLSQRGSIMPRRIWP